jgi:arylsulfatase A-like enzyme
MQDDEKLNPYFRLTPADREREEERLRTYYAMIENLDDNIGRLMEFLEAKGLSENTVVVFLSDHGHLCGEQSLDGKQHPFEESVGIPLILHDPHHPASHGKRTSEPINMEDIFPTICGLAGITARRKLPGTDLTELLADPGTALKRNGVLLELVAEFRNGFPYNVTVWRAFRSRRYKYVVLGGPEGSRPWQLFDLENDPFELHNLVEESEVVPILRQHHEWLREEIIRTEDHFVLSDAFGVTGVNGLTLKAACAMEVLVTDAD